MEAEQLWAGKGWPLVDDDHEFLVPAFNRIGRHLHGEKWRDHFASLDTFRVEATEVGAASAGERAWAHRTLWALFPDTYVEDYEPEPPASIFVQLGQLGTLGNLEPTSSSRRAPGWWFSDEEWATFRNAVHYQNELQKPQIKLVDAAARWLFNRVVRGEISPLAQNRKTGGDWQTTVPDDWRMPDPERLRGRIRRCTMIPGKSAWPGGTHWIIINKAELSAALEREAGQNRPEFRFEEAIKNGNITAEARADDPSSWKPYTKDEIASLIASGRPVLDQRGRKMSAARANVALALMSMFDESHGGRRLDPAPRYAKAREWFKRPENADREFPATKDAIKSQIQQLDKHFFLPLI